MHWVATTQKLITFRYHVLGPLYPLLSPSSSSPLIITTLLSVSVFLICLFVTFSFIPHIWMKPCGSQLFLTDLFDLAWYSQGPIILSQMSVYHLFLWLNSIPLHIYIKSSSPDHLLKDTLVVSNSSPWGEFYKWEQKLKTIITVLIINTQHRVHIL